MALASLIGDRSGNSEAIGPDEQASLESLLTRVNAVTLEQMTANSVNTTQILNAAIILAKIADGTFTADATGRGKFANSFVTRALQSLEAKGVGAYVRYEQQASSGTSGGGSVSSTWNIRPITNLVIDKESIGAGAPSSNRFTLPIGDYECRIMGHVNASAGHMMRLVFDPAGSPTYLYSMSGYQVGDNINAIAHLIGEFSLSSQETFEIQHYTATGDGGTGLGRGSNIGVTERHCIAEFWKVG